MPVRNSTSRAALAVLSMAQFLIALDYSIIYVALPHIADELHIELTFTQWIVSAYAVLFAGFLVVGGRLSDLVGARRLFIVAIVTFGVASAVGGTAGDGSVLLAARGAQGLGAAVLQPAVLALIGTTFPAGPSRNRALAVWGAVGALGLAAGAILGGLLTTVSWRLVFVVNVPLTILCAFGAAVWVTSAGDHPRADRIPVLASVLGTGTVLALVVGLTLGPGVGWGAAPTSACLGLALVLFLVFLRNERTSPNALIEPVLRETLPLRVGAGATALYMASVGSEFFLFTLLLQSAKGYSPLRTGLAFLPLAVLITVGNTAAGRVVRRYRPGTMLAGGFAVAAVGLLWLGLALHGDSYLVDLLPGLLLSGFGHGLIYTAMFIVGTGDVPTAHQGTAGALLTTSQYLSGAVTLAVLTPVLGRSPHEGDFRTGFLLTAGAAVAGLVLAALARRRPEACPDPSGAGVVSPTTDRRTLR